MRNVKLGWGGQGGERLIGPGYYRLTGSSLTRTTRAVRQTYRSPLGGNCGGRLLALGACPRQIQDTIKDLDGSNLPVWAPFAVLGGLAVAPLIPEVAGPLFESIFGAAAEHSAGVDLQAAEDAGGHTFGRHVGMTVEQLMTRNIPYASTFTDLSAAETATSDNIAANEPAITKWQAGASPRLAIQNSMDSAGGTIYERATQSFISPSAVNTVLVRTATGYRILTSYPIP